MSFRKYAEYKESGVEWLGEVPKHWVIGHLRWFISIKSGEGLPNSQVSKKPLDGENYCVIGSNGTLGYSKSFNTLPKAFAIGRVGSCGEVHFLKEKCWVTDNALKVSKWEGFNDSYFEYMLRAANLKQYANQSVQPLITGEQVKALPVPRLPLEEQNQIAAFLDKETTNTDTLIDKQEQLITLLREKRQAVISHAVTRGLDPNVKVKDSGIEWLGEVPEHWEVKKLKHILLRKKDSIKVGPFGSQLTTRDMEGVDIKVINQRNVIDNNFDFGDNFINHEKYIELRAFTIFPGDILITTRGTIGRTAIFPNNNGTSILHPCLMRLQVDEKYWLKELIALIIQGSGYFLEQLKFLSNATTIDVIYSENLKNVTIALPPTHEEQKRIIAFLDKETAKIDTLIEKCKTAIELLKERRTALISAAVTGKIDVRSAV